MHKSLISLVFSQFEQVLMGSTSRAVQNALEAVLAERLRHCDQVSQNERVDEESKLAQMLEQVPQSTGSRSTAPAT